MKPAPRVHEAKTQVHLPSSALESRLAAIEMRLAQIEARQPRRGPRDDCDVALITTLALSVVGRSFSCAEVLRHRLVDPALRQALDHADIDSTKQLGKLLRRLEGVPVAGLLITRVGRRRWRVHTSDMAPVR